ALSSQTAFPAVVEYPGYYELRQNVLLEPAVDNVFDASLRPVMLYAQATIGPEGGTVTDTTGRVTLDIPAGALTNATEITIRSAEDTLGNPWLFKGTVIELLPDGLEFNTPATLTLHYDSLAVPPGTQAKEFAIFTLDTLGWQPLEEEAVVTEPGRISATIAHFSRKAAGIRRFPGIRFLIHGYKSDFPQYDQPLGFLEGTVVSCRQGECSDTTFREIKPATDLPPWQSPSSLGPFDLFMSDCLIDVAQVQDSFTGLDDDLQDVFGQVAWIYLASFGRPSNLQPARTQPSWGAIFQSRATCTIVESPGKNVIAKGLSTLYLGDVDPTNPDARRFQLLITNPDQIEFDLQVQYSGLVFYDPYDGIIHLTQPTIIFNHGLQTCEQPFNQVNIPEPDLELITSPPEALEVKAESTYVYSGITAKYASLWIGLLMQAYCQSHFGDDPETIGYGARLKNNSQATFKLNVRVIPKRRSRR
ncbi:MAG: hypothetical protein D6814_17965, partial [Calditrichaeota bacterium]